MKLTPSSTAPCAKWRVSTGTISSTLPLRHIEWMCWWEQAHMWHVCVEQNRACRAQSNLHASLSPRSCVSQDAAGFWLKCIAWDCGCLRLGTWAQLDWLSSFKLLCALRRDWRCALEQAQVCVFRVCSGWSKVWGRPESVQSSLAAMLQLNVCSNGQCTADTGTIGPD